MKHLLQIFKLTLLISGFTFLGCKKNSLKNQPPNNVNNIVPVVNAGADTTIILPNDSVNLKGTIVNAIANISNYNWDVLTGPGPVPDFENKAALHSKVKGLLQGVYEFQLTVTESSGLKGTDVIKVTVLPPVILEKLFVYAGNDMVIYLPQNEVVLTGTTNIPSAQIVKKEWKKINGPNGGTIQSPGEYSTKATGLEEGQYAFEFSITNQSGEIIKDTCKTYVENPQRPYVQIEPWYVLTILPDNFTNLKAWPGYYNNAPFVITKTEWVKISGPANYKIEMPYRAETKISELESGVYEFECRMTATTGFTGKRSVTVSVVDPLSTNQEIIVNNQYWSMEGVEPSFGCAYMNIDLSNYIPLNKPVKKIFIKSNCTDNWKEILVTGGDDYSYSIFNTKMLSLAWCNGWCGTMEDPVSVKIVY